MRQPRSSVSTAGRFKRPIGRDRRQPDQHRHVARGSIGDPRAARLLRPAGPAPGSARPAAGAGRRRSADAAPAPRGRGTSGAASSAGAARVRRSSARSGPAAIPIRTSQSGRLPQLADVDPPALLHEAPVVHRLLEHDRRGAARRARGDRPRACAPGHHLGEARVRLVEAGIAVPRHRLEGALEPPGDPGQPGPRRAPAPPARSGRARRRSRRPRRSRTAGASARAAATPASGRIPCPPATPAPGTWPGSSATGPGRTRSPAARSRPETPAHRDPGSGSSVDHRQDRQQPDGRHRGGIRAPWPCTARNSGTSPM